jgi:undecaprenyl-diphosphatase
MFSDIIEIIILSLVQGVSEFLPISSSAHLIIISTLYEFKSSSLLIDISLHLGSLFAIVFFFRRELLDLQNNQKLLTLIIVGSIPLMVVGYILYTTNLIYYLRNIKVIAWTTLIFAIILFFADRRRFDKKISSNLNLKTILYIGFFQVLALIPGVSRAGITMTAARFFRFNRFDSSKISFLLAIPALVGASALSLKDVLNQSFDFNYLIIVAITFSFLFSYFTVKFFLDYINTFSLNVFIVYRILIAILIFLTIYN